MRHFLSILLPAVFLLVALPEKGAAMFAKMSIEELAENSHTIVEATFLGTRKAPSGKLVGILKVTRVLGGAKVNREVQITVKQPDEPVSSSDVFFRKGQSGLWFLEKVADDLYSADHPQRYVVSSKSAKVETRLKQILR